MIYKACFVLPMDGSVIEHGKVLVRDGEILAVGADIAGTHPGEPVHDLGACALMPGFVNAHSHIDYTLSRNTVDALNFWDWIDAVGFNKNRLPDPETIRLSALLGASELALSGVTCLGDSSYTGLAAEALGDVGLRGVVYLELFGQNAGTEYAQVFHKKLDHVRHLQGECSQRIKIGMSPHAIYTSNRGLLKLCTEACAELDIPIALHLAETWAEVDYSLDGTGPLAEWRKRLGYEPMVNGVRPAEYLHEIGLLRHGVCLGHCVGLLQEEVELVAGSGASVAHCPRSNAYLGAGIAPVVDLLAKGAPVGIGTDSAGSCMRLDFFEELRSALGLQRVRAEDATVLTAKSVLELATIGGARALGLADQIGSLEPGKRADMMAVDLGEMLPGEDIWLHVISRSPHDVRLVVVDGVEVAASGRLARVDVDACAAELRARMESLISG